MFSEEHSGTTRRMTEASARVIADSITEDGHRLTTFEATCWRPVLAEQNTHRMLSRNSASSRAIPVAKMLDRFASEAHHNPIVWPREQKGMQGGSGLEGEALLDAQDFWLELVSDVEDAVRAYVDSHPDPENRLHKSLLNRWLEVGLWQTQIISATSWEGYFWQRCHKDAEPHIRAMAEALRDAYDASEPKPLQPSGWHLPYWAENGGHESDWDDANGMVYDPVESHEKMNQDRVEIAKRCSAARCARVSYLTQNGERDLSEDLLLYARLTSNRVGSEDPPHASPLEHVATPWPENSQHVVLPNGTKMGPLPKLGNFTGWLQLRHDVLGF
jgi:hypothetical protein